MRRLFNIEFLKLKHYRPFWIIIGLFSLLYFILGFGFKIAIDWFISHGPDELKYFQKSIPLFDYVDIWQNMAYITGVFKWILAFIIIISVCNEFSQKTVRQNVIDGLSRKEFLASKVILIGAISLFGMGLLLLLCLALGLLYSPVRNFSFIFMNVEFVLGFGLDIFVFLCFAMLFALLIRRTGFTIIFFIFYAGLVEPIATAILKFNYELPNWFFPMRAINNIVRQPMGKYVLFEVQTHLSIIDVGVAILWCGIILWLSYKFISSKNL